MNSGFVTTTVAKELKAAVIFGEHRFFGKSWPGGDFTGSNKPEVYKFLTTEQAQNDFVKMFDYLQNPDDKDPNKGAFANLNVGSRAVIVFGGSYGGMLAAWMRMKFPQTFAGAHAASAPILFTPGSISPYGFNEIITRDFRQYGANCPDFVRKGQFSLRTAASDKTQYAAVKTAFNTCDDITTPDEVSTLADFVNSAFGTYAMVNYPYPADLLG